MYFFTPDLHRNRGGSASGRCRVGLLRLGFRVGVLRQHLLLGLHDAHVIRQRLPRSHLAIGIPGQHDFHLDAEDALSEEDMPAGRVHVVIGRVSRVDHQTIDELHGLGALSSKLARDDDLAALSARLHDEAEDAVAGASHGQAADQLVTKRLGLGDGAKSPSRDFLGVELDRVLRKVESLLDDGREFTDASAFLAQDVLRPRRHDDDFGPRRRHSDLDAGVAVLGQLAGQKLVQFGFEDAIGDKLKQSK